MGSRLLCWNCRDGGAEEDAVPFWPLWASTSPAEWQRGWLFIYRKDGWVKPHHMYVIMEVMYKYPFFCDNYISQIKWKSNSWCEAITKWFEANAKYNEIKKISNVWRLLEMSPGSVNKAVSLTAQSVCSAAHHSPEPSMLIYFGRLQ